MAFPVHSAVTRTVSASDGFGNAHISPDGAIIAAEFGTWQLSFEAGRRGLADGARIVIRTDSDTDWGVPQFLNAAADDFMSVQTPDGVHCSVKVGGPKCLSLQIHGRDVAEGERIALTLGDRSGGSRGSRAQTFLEAEHYFLFEVDVRGDGDFVILEDSPCCRILGGDATRLVLTAPSEVVPGEEFSLLIKAEDAWGNSSSTFAGNVKLTLENVSGPSESLITQHPGSHPMDCGVCRVGGFTLDSGDAGDSQVVGRITAESDALNGTGNPIVSLEASRSERLFWADPHGGQVGTATKIADFFRYARDVSDLQFVGYQRNADVISEADWDIQQEAERELFEPGRFIPIPGFEWSGCTPEGGHHNVYFRRHNQPVQRNPPAEAVTRVDPENELVHIRDVYQAYRNTDTIITPHVGGEHSNLTWHDPTLEPAMEISSSHGSFEWAIREIMERGYQLGFLGGSDCYTGRPGDDRPGFQQRRYAKSGVTGIYAKDVSLESFFEAMRARRVYATTGARIVLNVSSNAHWLGERFTTSAAPKFEVNVVGTDTLRSVEVFRGLERVYWHELPGEPIPDSVRIVWTGASRMSSYSGIVWDGQASFEGASVRGVRPLRFDSPRSQVEQNDNDVKWHAWGCGYPMGVVVSLADVAPDSSLQISLDSQLITGPMYGGHGEKGPPRRISFAPADRVAISASIGELGDAPLELDLGVLDRRLEVSLEPQGGSKSANFEFTDELAEPGVNRYWIRVVQSDLEMAWSSPLFIDYSPGETC